MDTGQDYSVSFDPEIHGVVIVGAGSTFVIENKVPIRNSNELNVIRIYYD